MELIIILLILLALLLRFLLAKNSRATAMLMAFRKKNIGKWRLTLLQARATMEAQNQSNERVAR